jgi:hypothetical protein
MLGGMHQFQRRVVKKLKIFGTGVGVIRLRLLHQNLSDSTLKGATTPPKIGPPSPTSLLEGLERELPFVGHYSFDIKGDKLITYIL